MNDILEKELRLRTEHIGRSVRIYHQLASTNDLASQWATSPDRDGDIIMAREQIAGRGQYGRTWSSPPDTSILCSVVLFPPTFLARPVLLTAWAAIAVCHTVEAWTGIQPTIKWPNDVLIEGGKVCGILIEQGRATIAGIGVNVNQQPEHFAEAGLPDATALCQWTEQELFTEDVAISLFHQLDECYQPLMEKRFEDLEAEWRARLGLEQEVVTVEHAGGQAEGRLERLSFDRVEIRTGGDDRLSLKPEQIRQLKRA